MCSTVTKFAHATSAWPMILQWRVDGVDRVQCYWKLIIYIAYKYRTPTPTIPFLNTPTTRIKKTFSRISTPTNSNSNSSSNRNNHRNNNVQQNIIINNEENSRAHREEEELQQYLQQQREYFEEIDQQFLEICAPVRLR